VYRVFVSVDQQGICQNLKNALLNKAWAGAGAKLPMCVRFMSETFGCVYRVRGVTPLWVLAKTLSTIN